MRRTHSISHRDSRDILMAFRKGNDITGDQTENNGRVDPANAREEVSTRYWLTLVSGPEALRGYRLYNRMEKRPALQAMKRHFNVVVEATTRRRLDAAHHPSACVGMAGMTRRVLPDAKVRPKISIIEDIENRKHMRPWLSFDDAACAPNRKLRPLGRHRATFFALK